jgi:hypothetical protein
MGTTSLALLAVWWIAWLAGSALLMFHARAGVVRFVLALGFLGVAGLTFGWVFAGVADNGDGTALAEVRAEASIVRQSPARALTVASLYRWLLLLPVVVPAIAFSVAT